MKTWRDVADEMIQNMARIAYEKANRLPNGKLRKKYVLYTLPDLACELTQCLGDHDQKRGEERAKALMGTHEGERVRFHGGD